MDPSDARGMIGHVSRLMGQRLGARGATLEARVKSRARRLPRKVRRAALILVAAERRVASPRLARQLDMSEIARAHDVCVRHLGPIGRRQRLGAFARNFAATIVLALVVLAVVAMFLQNKGLL